MWILLDLLGPEGPSKATGCITVRWGGGHEALGPFTNSCCFYSAVMCSHLCGILFSDQRQQNSAWLVDGTVVLIFPTLSWSLERLSSLRRL